MSILLAYSLKNHANVPFDMSRPDEVVGSLGVLSYLESLLS